MSVKRVVAGLILLNLQFFILDAQALPEDRRQPIEIQSLEAIREETKGLTVYTGNVTIVQGTIRIQADKVTVHSDKNKVNKIVGIGKPAEYQQQSKPDSAPVVARGNSIEYNLVSDIILMIGDASLRQEDSILTGERIEYDLKKEVIRAKGGSNTGRERIRMVIPPSQQPGTE